MDLLAYIITFIHILPPVVYAIYYKRNNKLSRIILFYCIYSIINEAARQAPFIESLIPDSSQADSIFLSSFTIIEYLFFAYYLFHILKNRKFKVFLTLSSIVFLVVATLNLVRLLTTSAGNFDAIPISVGSIILIIVSILYLFEAIQDPEIIFVYSKQSFWIIIGIMIYFSGTFFLFLQYDSLTQDEKNSFWIISIICFVLKNIFFSISFTLKPENQQPLHVDELYLKNTE